MLTAPAKIGELAYITTVLNNTHVFGLVSDGDTPDGFTATFEITGDQGVLVIPALKGDTGPAGNHAFALRLQLSTIDDPLNLPQTLGITEADVGKYWMIDDVDAQGNVIGSSAYIWFGDHYRRMMMGTRGPVGPVPRITPNFHWVAPEDPNQLSRVISSGDPYSPQWDWYLQKEDIRGPQGIAGPFRLSPDVLITDPHVGDVISWDGTVGLEGFPIWKNMQAGNIIGKPYTVPEAAFTHFEGMSTRATIGSFQIPMMTFPFKVLVWGHIKAFGIELDPDPLTIGVEVRLGNPTSGALVARGFGSFVGQATLLPHTSEPGAPTIAMTPENSVAKVIANQTNPTMRTVYVNLFNDGLTGVYLFSPADAQLFVMAQPV